MPLYPEMLQTKERTSTPYPSFVFTFGFVVESIKEFGVHHIHSLFSLQAISIFFQWNL